MAGICWQARQEPQDTQSASRALWRTLPLAVLLLAGCSTSPGSSSSLFNQHRLLASTLAVRQPDIPLPLPRECDKRPLPPYTVEPGDVLLVLPAEVDTLPAEDIPPEKNPTSPLRIPADQPVLPDGSINLGRYGRVMVFGKTVEQIEASIRATIQAQIKRDPGFISVRIVTRDSKIYYVLGEVNAPGTFQLKGRETALDGILAAGGLNDKASRENIILSRPTGPNCCRVVLPVCYREITQLGDTTTNYQLAPGDRIFVPARTLHENLCQSRKCGMCRHFHYPCPIPPPGSEDPAQQAFIPTAGPEMSLPTSQE